MRAHLVERFPAAFQPNGGAKPPLMIGIYHQLRAACPEISGRRLSIFLHEYTAGTSYQSRLVEGAIRVDLDGNPAGVVTEAEAERAREAIDKMSRGALT